MKPQKEKCKIVTCARCVANPGESLEIGGWVVCPDCKGSGRLYKSTTYEPAPGVRASSLAASQAHHAALAETDQTRIG